MGRQDARSARIFLDQKKAFPGDPGVLAFRIIFIMLGTLKRIFIVLSVLLLAGCSTTGNKTPSLNQTLAVITSPTARTLSSVARSSDPKSALKKSIKSRKSVYETNPYALVRDVRTISNSAR